MCGIAGIVRHDAADAVSPHVLAAMVHALGHRGPDSRGVHVAPGVGLAHARLAILDLSPRGAQPMKGQADSWIVFNGEFYDYRRKRAELEARGRVFRSDCDTEVILALYEERGLEFVHEVEGQFALAIWDGRARRLVLARDRLGKKPLYWHLGPRGLAFASELTALLGCPEVPRSIDGRALADFLTYHYVPDPRSIYAGVSKLPPGHLAVWQPGERALEPRRYFWLDQTTDESLPFEAAARELRTRLEAAVERRLVSDVPLGAFLSGGVDSSSVVALMAGLVPDLVTTSSIGFEEDEWNELDHAREVARLFRTDHHEAIVRPSARESAPVLARHFGEPFADASALPTWHLARLARERVTVALSGDGGDELLGGYRKYATSQVEASVRGRLPARARRALGAIGRAWPSDSRVPKALRAGRVLRYLGDSEAAAVFRQNDCLGDELRSALPGEELRLVLRDHDPARVTTDVWEQAKARGLGPLGRWLAVDLATYLPGDILVKVDRMSLAHSLEVRSPFLDERVLALAARLPERHKLEGGRGKRVLKEAMKDLLPARVLERKKMGFGVPLDRWFRGELAVWGRDLVLSPDALDRGWLDAGAVASLWREHDSGRRDRGAVLWSLAQLELWFREVHEAERPRAPESLPIEVAA